jgi:1-acyl-sn-glycerol-3-phosphate acyltransferase
MNNTQNQQDKVTFLHVFYTIYGWTLFVVINVIQFIFFMPLFLLFSLVFDKDKKSFVYLTKFFSWLFFIFYFVERIQYDKNNLPKQKKGTKRIYVINHASQYDVILMYLLPGPIKFLFKEKWARLPLVGWMAAIGGNIVLKDDAQSAEAITLFRKSINMMGKGYPFIIYPEGTRSRDGKIGEFFHGSFKLALDAQAEIVPVVFDTWNSIRPGALWIRDVRPTIKVLEPIPYEEIKHLNFIKVSHLVRIKMIEGLIQVRKWRREHEKNYYRKLDQFEKIDHQMQEELEQLHEFAAKKKIFLKSDPEYKAIIEKENESKES